jgi:hypothetical protein
VTRLLAGRYRLLRQLGRGGMGTVWQAHDAVLGRDVAVKELSLPRRVAEEHRAALCERAIREAQVSSRLRHPSIIRVHDVIAEDDRPWIVMELLTGRPLDEAGPLPPRRVAGIGLAVLGALNAAHAGGVLHRDVKPGNIFLCDDGRVVLADFGIAGLEGDASLTASGGLVGSPGYIAPERLRGEHAGPPSDLWSLGAALYAGVESRPAFERQTPMGLLGAVLTEEPRSPRRAGPLGPLLLAMLAKDPARRPSADVTERWLRSVAHEETPGKPMPLAPTLPSGMAATGPVTRPGRGRLVAVVAVLVAAVAAVPAAFLLTGGPTGDKAAPRPRATHSPDPVRGRFAVAPQPCSLITSTDAGRLGVSPMATPEAEGCSWGESLRGRSLQLQIQHFAPARGWSAPSLAEAYYADKQRQLTASAHVNDKIHSSQSAPTGLPATGDAAFVYNATDGIDSGRSAVVWMRYSNVVVKIVYADETGASTASRLYQGAVAAARTVGAHLAQA